MPTVAHRAESRALRRYLLLRVVESDPRIAAQWTQGGAMADINEALAASRDAVERLIGAG